MGRCKPELFVVMGATGTGKSAVGEALATAFDWPFQEGDDLHPASNVAKMSQGIPLTDQDRWPWLDRCHEWLEGHATTGGIITCSALKRSYRDALRAKVTLTFIYLWAPAATLEERLRHRTHHFMPASLVPSQVQTLEPPQEDEPVITIDARPSREDVCQAAIKAIRAKLEADAHQATH